ncbi:MAG TPA: ribosome recycling factor [Candidatus Paceibacterota bacterium]|nr:ribosome recycling factor [Candidatus Paceibacterota bacterium]HMP18866.1 ribosome recycling factor [Candidatus Paceibacterota bacterium]HMP85170.1 ribosome recycling factor [Candidatus Paceibacterota bacterium]
MTYDFKQFKNQMSEVENWLKKELATIRTGRASSALLDNVKVNFYGSLTPINQTASIISEDPKTLRIQPYDLSQSKNIEKSITEANLGVSVIVNDAGIRVIFPELTSERREILIKQASKKLEEARISVRKHRDETWNDIQAKEKAKQISEDDKFRAKEDMQKIVDESQKKLEDLVKAKELEIKS